MSIPFELVTLIGSTLLSGVMTLWSQSIRAKGEASKRMIAALEAKATVIHEARTYENAGFEWTRRSIALMSVLAIIVLPKLAALFMPEVLVTVGYTEFHPGFLFFPETESISWKSFTGLAITPLDTHLVSSITGMYFGASLVKNA